MRQATARLDGINQIFKRVGRRCNCHRHNTHGRAIGGAKPSGFARRHSSLKRLYSALGGRSQQVIDATRMGVPLPCEQFLRPDPLVHHAVTGNEVVGNQDALFGVVCDGTRG